jgi:KDO2-lipid IV(A) lauroyltransferase
MNKSIGYYILKACALPMQLFPLEFHYLISDGLYFFMYYIVAYRRKVVANNLKHAFPEKEHAEIRRIEKKFYRGFADMFIETLYLSHVWTKRDKNRLELKNIELIYKHHRAGRNVIVVSGHFGNWEFMQLFQNKYPESTYFIYRNLHNKAFDELYRSLRARVAIPLEMRETYRKLLAQSKQQKPWIALFISDQRPPANDLKNWLTFMNRQVPIMTGTERIAQKTNAVIVYLEVCKISRGHHQARFEMLEDKPQNTSTMQISSAFFKRLEKSIIQNPHQYFWTHKRWKFKKEEHLS